MNDPEELFSFNYLNASKTAVSSHPSLPGVCSAAHFIFILFEGQHQNQGGAEAAALAAGGCFGARITHGGDEGELHTCQKCPVELSHGTASVT